MILQALKEYYDRKADDPESGIAPEGWESREIHALLRITGSGEFVSIESMVDNNFRATKFLVPQGRYRSGQKAYAMPFLLWDHCGFVLGHPKSSSHDDRTMAQKQREHFAAQVVEYSEKYPDNQGIKAVADFYRNEKFNDVLRSNEWQAFVSNVPANKTLNMSFSFVGEQRLIVESLDLVNNDEASEKEIRGICLITGEEAVLAELNSPIGGVTQKPAPLVSINDKTGGTSFSSYGKTQCYNSPISKSSAFRYSTALKRLLDPEKVPSLRVGDMRIAYWSGGRSWLENEFSFLFQESEIKPEAGARAVKSLYDSIKNGAYIYPDGRQRFYVLGMAPNSGRIAIKSWHDGTIAEMACHIQQHFDDLEMIRHDYEKTHHYPLWRLLCNVAPQGESKNVPPNIAADFFASILVGVPYPASLLQAAIRRTHAGIKRKTKAGETRERVIPEIAALLKAYLNRYHRVHPNPNHKEIQMSLDTSQPSIGYQLGRLFATLEKIQEEANRGINATIRERFYGAACSTPVVVFANLMRLKNHHLPKIGNRGRVINFERLLAEIVGRFDDFPAHLDLHEQGRFAIGYYHQRQDFFTRKNDSENS